MCDPVSVAVAATVAAGGASVYATRQQGKFEQNRANLNIALPVLLNKETKVMGGKTSSVAMANQANNQLILIQRIKMSVGTVSESITGDLIDRTDGAGLDIRISFNPVLFNVKTDG